MLKRVTKEHRDMLANPVEGISAGPKPGDKIAPNWDGFIHGPKNTPYEGGVFKLSIVFPSDYPFKPPKVKFITKILHCGVRDTGDMCCCPISDLWGPATTIQKVLMNLRQLLMAGEPKLECILDSQLALLWRKDPEEYNRKVREATLQFAIPQHNFDSDRDATADEEQ